MRLFTAEFAGGLYAVLLAGISHYAFCGETMALAPSAESVVSPLQTVVLPLYFEPNLGQFHERVHAAARGSEYAVALSPEGIAVHPRQRAATPMSLPERRSEKVSRTGPPPASAQPSPIQLRWIDSSPRAQVTYEQPLPGVSHYFLGSDAKAWRTDVPHYARVRYHDVYPGIDVLYYGVGQQLEYDLEVRPGADPGKVAFEFSGADAVTADATGALHLKTDAGELLQHSPRVYQRVGNAKRDVQATLKPLGNNRFALNIGAHDPGKTLVIDPVISYSTFVGGIGDEMPMSVAVDAGGSVYLAGATTSPNFGGDNPFDPMPPAGGRGAITAAYVAKLDAQGRNLLFLAYFGGSGGAAAMQVLVDAPGSAYVTGLAGLGFPTTAGAYQSTNPAAGVYQFTRPATSSGGIPFIAKLNATGNGLMLSTYLGAVSNVDGYSYGTIFSGAALAGNGRVAIAGFGPAGHPTTRGVIGISGGGSYVSVLAADGGSLVYSTFFNPAAGSTAVRAIAADATGNVYLTGGTNSPNVSTPGAFQTTLAGSMSAFVTKLNPGGTAMVYSTYLGGPDQLLPCSSMPFGSQAGNAIALDASGNAYVGGYTFSEGFPVVNAWIGGQTNIVFGSGFVSKLNPSGTALLLSGYLGGFHYGPTNCPEIEGLPQSIDRLAIDAQGNVFVTGEDYLMGTGLRSFPRVSPLWHDGTGFTAAITAGPQLSFSSYMPAGGLLAVDPQSNVYLAFAAGQRGIVLPGGYEEQFQGSSSGFNGDSIVYKLGFPNIGVSLASSAPSVTMGQSVTLTASLSGTNNAGTIAFQDGAAMLGTVNVAARATSGTLTVPSFARVGVHSISAVYTDSTVPWGIFSLPLYQAVNQPATCD